MYIINPPVSNQSINQSIVHHSLVITLPPLKLPLTPTLEPSPHPAILGITLAVMLITTLSSRPVPVLSLALSSPPMAIAMSSLAWHVAQSQTLGHLEEDVDGAVDSAEEFLAGTHGEHGHVCEGVDALVGGCGEGAIVGDACG